MAGHWIVTKNKTDVYTKNQASVWFFQFSKCFSFLQHVHNGMIQNWMFKLTCKLSLCLCDTLFTQVYIIHTLIKLDVKLVWKFNSTNLLNSYFTKVWVHIPSLNIQINLYVHLYVRLKTLPFCIIIIYITNYISSGYVYYCFNWLVASVSFWNKCIPLSYVTYTYTYYI